jgi:hypothetical protein
LLDPADQDPSDPARTGVGDLDEVDEVDGDFVGAPDRLIVRLA